MSLSSIDTKSMLFKVAIVFLLVLLYVYLLRPLRAHILEYFVQLIWNTDGGNVIGKYTVAYGNLYTLTFSSIQETRTWVIRMPFGRDFLLPLIGLIFVKRVFSYIYYLVQVHLFLTIVVFSSIYLAIGQVKFGLYVGDFVTIYLSPIIGLLFFIIWRMKDRIDKKSIFDR